MAATEEYRSFWARLGRPARLGLIVGIVVIIAGATALALWSSRSDYGVLFSQLNETDAASVVARLKDQKVPYRLTDGGGTIEIPAARVYDTRLALFSSGLPLSGGVGFSIYDHQGYGLTEQDQRVEYQRALQGELAHTIDSLDGVRYARVHLVIPPRTIFRADREQPSAAVSLVLKPGVSLTDAQVQGMQRLVAASIAGLEPTKVIINDQRGITLSAVSPNQSGAIGSDARLGVESEVERYIASKIAKLLDRAYGPGQALVSVDVALNFDQVKTTIQSLVPVQGSRPGDPQGAVVRRQQVSTGGAASQSLATGSGTLSGANPLNSTTDVQYEYGRRVEQIVSTPGSITRMSIGVVVPGSLTEEKRQRITALVRMAAGVVDQRGDQIDVEPLDAIESARTASTPAVGAAMSEALPPARTVAVHVPAVRATVFRWDAIELGTVTSLIAGGLLGVALGRRARARKPLAPSERQKLLAEMERALSVDVPVARSQA